MMQASHCGSMAMWSLLMFGVGSDLAMNNDTSEGDGSHASREESGYVLWHVKGLMKTKSGAT